MRPGALWLFAAALGLGVVPAARADSGIAAGAARVEAARGDPAALAAVLDDASADGRTRALALLALGRSWPSPLPGPARLRLKALLSDPAPAVRRAAVRVVRERGERPLGRDVLRLAAEDPDPGVRAEALETAEPWVRPTHLYFLEKALASEDPAVRAGAVRSLGRLGVRDLRPDLLDRVRELSRRGEPRVRAAALRALGGWGRLTDPDLVDVLADPRAPEFLVLSALEAAGGRRAQPVAEAVVGVLERAGSPRLAWACFGWLTRNGPADGRVDRALARFLDGRTQVNRALRTFARRLEAAGYRVEHGRSGWRVLKRP